MTLKVYSECCVDILFDDSPLGFVLGRTEDGFPIVEDFERRDDGTINYNSLATVTASVVLNGCDDMLATWQFMQWQTSAEIQANYGNKMVALIGPSAKYESANLKALKNISWTASEYAAIEDQLNNLSSIVNYPGSYIISRYMRFAFLAAVNDGADPTDALTGYIDDINYEIERKRIELGLEIGDPPED